jgi:hypothetical protein
MPTNDEERRELAALREEVVRLRAENERLQPRHEPPAPTPRGKRKASVPVRVLLVPDPTAPPEPGKLGPRAIANLADTVLSILRGREPGVEWRAEHDLDRIPDEGACFQLGHVVRRMFEAGGAPPMTFRMETSGGGVRSLRRCLIAGEPDSERFSVLYERKLAVVDDLLAEGEAAYHAHAHHHAHWSLKAADVVLAELNLALAQFQAGTDDWCARLTSPRPEYQPRHRVHAELPAGM